MNKFKYYSNTLSFKSASENNGKAYYLCLKLKIKNSYINILNNIVKLFKLYSEMSLNTDKINFFKTF